MRIAIVLAVLVVAAVLGSQLLDADSSSPERPDDGPRVDAPPAEGPRSDELSSRREEERSEPNGGSAAKQATDPETQPEPAEPPAEGSVELHVVDAKSGAVIPEALVTLTGDGVDRAARTLRAPMRVDIPTGVRASARVEAQGFEPAPEVDVSLQPDEAGRRVVVELTAVMRSTGIELTVLNAEGFPAKRVRVTAAVRPLDTNDQHQRLWTRQTEREDGVYTLPDVEPGSYRFVINELDESGRETISRQHTVDIDYRGAQLFQQQVQLQMGAQIDLKLTDRSRLPISVSAFILDANDQPIDVRWVGVNAEGARQAGTNVTPATETVWLEDALPANRYTLVIEFEEQRLATRPLVLRPGTREVIPLQVDA